MKIRGDTMKYIPKFDSKVTPLSVKLKEYRKEVATLGGKLLKICVERNDGYNYIYDLQIFSDASKQEENYRVAERLIKSILSDIFLSFTTQAPPSIV